MNLPIELENLPKEHDCDDRTLEKVDHSENRTDWDNPSSSQGYQIYQCAECGDYWGCRYQWDAGTGNDDRWHRFGSSPIFRRHY